MARKPKSVTYIVHWPESNIVKVGVSERRRWRAFLQRGATIVDLIEHDDPRDSWVWETLVQSAFGRVSQPAFISAADAEPYLGNHGGGYCECFQLAPGDTPRKVLESTNWENL